MTVTYGSLFSGIGMLDCGVEMAFKDAGIPIRCVWQVENTEFPRAVLAKHWPDVERHDDVKTFARVDSAVAIPDVIVGGFPCVDVSLAGKGKGLAGERSGLWFEYLRIVQKLRPIGVIVENVSGLLRRGLDVVVSGLTDAGYEVEATRIRASDVGAPHRRERIFIVAYADGAWEPQSRGSIADVGRRSVDGGDTQLADPGGERREGAERREPKLGAALQRAWREGPDGSQSGIRRGANGCTNWLDGHRWPAPQGPQFEWEPPRTQANVPNRGNRLKALGNAVVPQCSYIAAKHLIERLRLA